jgi:predicted Zn-dependent protease
MVKTFFKSMLLMALATTTFVAGAGRAQVNLPDIGSPADSVLSKSEEAKIGRAIMANIRQQGGIIDDPEINEYINDIGRRLSAHANNGDYTFTFFVVDDPRINAFALPGGFIGVHSGLLQATRNEDELAGVLAHEIAHVTQRHIARAVHANSRQGILTMAMMLGAILAGVGGAGSDAIQGAIAVAQGTAAQQQINFTRHNEYEADRVGMAALVDAGFDPHGMASFFEVLSMHGGPSQARFPEFLRTHPVTSTRIAEARSRARDYDHVPTLDSTNYGIAKARLKVEEQTTVEAAVFYFEQTDYADQTPVQKYGRALAYLRAGRNADANRILEELLDNDQDVIAYHIALAESQLAMDDKARSIETFERAFELFPRNVPLVIHYAETLLQLEQPGKAHKILLDLLNNVPPTPEQVRLIARAASEAGDTAEAYYYMAEHSIMVGDIMQGVGFLRQALKLPELQEIQRMRFEARIDFLKDYMTEEQLRAMQRSRG